MVRGFKSVSMTTMVWVFLIVLMTNTPVSSAAKSDASGFVKVAGNIGLKEDGSLWSVPQDDGQKYTKISDGYMDIDTDDTESTYIALKKDNTLWVWGKEYVGPFEENIYKETDKPVKVADNVKAISGLSFLKKDSSLWAWENRVFPKKDSSLNVNKPIWRCKDVKSIAYGSKCIYIIDNKSTLYAIKKYLYTSPFIKGDKVKIEDNVKFAANNYYITNDNKLWGISIIEEKFEEDSVIEYKYDFIPKLMLTNVIYTNSNDDSSFNRGTSCAIKADGSLWVWGMEYMHYKSKGSGMLPQKLMNGVKYAKCGYKNIQIIKDDGTICTYGFKCPKSNYSIPKVHAKDVVKVCEDFPWYITKDDTLMWGPSPESKYFNTILCKNASENVEWNPDGAIVKNTYGNKEKYYFRNGITRNYVETFDSEYVKQFSSGYVKNDNTVWVIDWEAGSDFYPVYKKIDINGANIKEIYSSYDSNIYILYNDNTFWISAGKYVAGKYYSVVEYQPPEKLMDGVKEVEFVNYHTFAITDSGALYGWLCSPEVSEINFESGKKIMDDVEAFDKKTDMFDIIKKDKSHWNLTCPTLENRRNEEFNRYIALYAYKDIDSMENFKYYCQDFYIKSNGELWVRGYGDDAYVSYFSNEIKLNFGKVMDNVAYAEHDYDGGLALCSDGSLWQYGAVKLYNFPNDPIIVNGDIKPRKIMDDVKEFDIKYNSCAVLKKDGSLYVWGDNISGQMGNGTTEFVNKPLKILDDIEHVFVYEYSMWALKKDGTLMEWGYGSYPTYSDKPCVENPISIAVCDNKILHNNYEAVGVDEDITIQVKINDLNYTKNVKVILQDGREISLDKSNGGYFSGIIPGIKKAGILKYNIVATDANGNIIKSDEYLVQILKNERVLYDLKNGEFIQKDFKIIIDGREFISEFVPLILIKDGRTLLTARDLSDLLGADIKWDGATKTVNISINDKSILFKIESKEVMVNNKKVTIDTAPIIIDGRTLLPLRSVCELLGAEVDMDMENKAIIIKSDK